MPPTGDLAHNPGLCPDWELNQWRFDLQVGTQSTEPHQLGLIHILYGFLKVEEVKFLGEGLCIL